MFVELKVNRFADINIRLCSHRLLKCIEAAFFAYIPFLPTFAAGMNSITTSSTVAPA
jgi:hypothetical protein